MDITYFSKLHHILDKKHIFQIFLLRMIKKNALITCSNHNGSSVVQRPIILL